jgi:hypothetical protein
MNNTIDDRIKMKLVDLLVIKYSANIAIIPNNIVMPANKKLSIFDKILLIVNDIPNTPDTKASILQLFSINKEFKKMLEESKTDLSKFTSKNRIIEALTTQVNILKNSIVKFQEGQKGKIASNLINSNIIALQTGGQANSKQIQKRTFNLLKHKKYYEYPFIAERPIIAAHNAYDFLKLHDKISRKQIIFSIYDIVNNKKYRYIAKTLKDGKNVIKSAK